MAVKLNTKGKRPVSFWMKPAGYERIRDLAEQTGLDLADVLDALITRGGAWVLVSHLLANAEFGSGTPKEIALSELFRREIGLRLELNEFMAALVDGHPNATPEDRAHAAAQPTRASMAAAIRNSGKKVKA